MFRNFLNRIATLLKGNDYRIDPDIGTSALVGLAFRRSTQISRGFITLRKKVFLGKRVKIVNKKYLKIGYGVTIQDGAYIDALSKNGVQLGNNCNIGPLTVIQATGVLTRIGTGLSIGNNSGIGGFSFIGCGGGVSIGNNVIMGQYVSFHSENHVTSDLNKPIRTQGVTRTGIVVGDDCWIGAKSTFVDGAKVGRGCIVAAGSVVRGDIPAYSVIAGVPARVIKSRIVDAPKKPGDWTIGCV